jgi:hypothetical protein
MFHPVLLEELVVDEQNRTTGVAENVIDVLLLQTSDHNFSAADFHLAYRKK